MLSTTPRKMIQKPEMVTIDVEGLSLGRAASVVAVALRGKDRADFVHYRALHVKVHIKNYDKIKIGKGLAKKIYIRYTGYPSGLRKTPFSDLYEKNPEEILRKAVWGMLPKNKLRNIFIKNLIIE